MNQSRLYIRRHFLLNLGRSLGRTRLEIVNNINTEQMDCLTIIAKQFTTGQLRILRRDIRTFSRYSKMLKTLASMRISLNRKKKVLKQRHTLLTRMLRRVYLRNAILNEIRTSED